MSHKPFECQNCGPVETLALTIWEVKDISHRVEPGEPLPAGECECGALAHLAMTDRQEAIIEYAKKLYPMDEDYVDETVAPEEPEEENGCYISQRRWISFKHTDFDRECPICENIDCELATCAAEIEYDRKVSALEEKGITRSDAQAIVDAEERQNNENIKS